MHFQHNPVFIARAEIVHSGVISIVFTSNRKCQHVIEIQLKGMRSDINGDIFWCILSRFETFPWKRIFE
jgi:hypothetical protein